MRGWRDLAGRDEPAQRSLVQYDIQNEEMGIGGADAPGANGTVQSPSLITGSRGSPKGGCASRLRPFQAVQ